MKEHEYRFITTEEVSESASRIALHLLSNKPSGSTGRHRHFADHWYLYGVPRGGIPAALAVSASVHAFSDITVSLTSDAAEADVIIDDLVDSGRTRDDYAARFPHKPFFALFEKTPGDPWCVFPWEGTAESSAEDIPIRLLQYIGENPTREGLRETPARFLKAWRAYTSGYAMDAGTVLKTFQDGAERVDEMVLVKDIPVYSHCEHHLAPFFGKAHVAYIPNGQVVGLSKLVRLVQVYARRLQVQERLTQQIAHALDDALSPSGVGVIVECRHLCMEARGVMASGTTTKTSCVLGVLKTDAAARAEFVQLCGER